MSVTISGWTSNTRIANNSFRKPVFTNEGAEPVTLAEAKEWMKVDFSDSDAWITALIKMCRQALESYTGVGLITRTVTVEINNSRGNIELPYGPVTTFTTLTDKEGDAVIAADYKIYGAGFQYMESPNNDYYIAVYTAGYTPSTIPQDLKMDLLRMIAYCNEHRGDEESEKMALRMFGASHRRLTWLL